MSKRINWLIIYLVIITIFIFVGWIIYDSANAYFILYLPSSIAIAFSILIEIWKLLKELPILKIQYIEEESKEEETDNLYELYHHKDVPWKRDKKHFRYWLLIGLKNYGNCLAKNCYAKLWIFDKSNPKKPIDNPFNLYWFHDPNSREKPAKPPELFNLAAKDEQFLAVCYIKDANAGNKFGFADFGQHTTRRQKIMKDNGYENGPKEFYIDIIAYCQNGDYDKQRFKIEVGKKYPDLKMWKDNSKKDT